MAIVATRLERLLEAGEILAALETLLDRDEDRVVAIDSGDIDGIETSRDRLVSRLRVLESEGEPERGAEFESASVSLEPEESGVERLERSNQQRRDRIARRTDGLIQAWAARQSEFARALVDLRNGRRAVNGYRPGTAENPLGLNITR